MRLKRFLLITLIVVLGISYLENNSDKLFKNTSIKNSVQVWATYNNTKQINDWKKIKYVYNEETESYENSGKISSTKLELSDVEIEGFNIVLKEKTMCALRNTFITFMVVFGILDLACIVIIVLTKKGIIKTKEKSNGEISKSEESISEINKEESVVQDTIIEKPKNVKSLEEYFENKDK